jgi:hypothetical protein
MILKEPILDSARSKLFTESKKKLKYLKKNKIPILLRIDK